MRPVDVLCFGNFAMTSAHLIIHKVDVRLKYTQVDPNDSQVWHSGYAKDCDVLDNIGEP